MTNKKHADPEKIFFENLIGKDCTFISIDNVQYTYTLLAVTNNSYIASFQDMRILINRSEIKLVFDQKLRLS